MGPPEIGADPGLPMSPAQVGAHKQKGRVLCWGPPPHYPKWSRHPSGPQPPVFLIKKFLGLWPTPKGWELEGIESPVEHMSPPSLVPRIGREGGRRLCLEAGSLCSGTASAHTQGWHRMEFKGHCLSCLAFRLKTRHVDGETVPEYRCSRPSLPN